MVHSFRYTPLACLQSFILASGWFAKPAIKENLHHHSQQVLSVKCQVWTAPQVSINDVFVSHFYAFYAPNDGGLYNSLDK